MVTHTSHMEINMTPYFLANSPDTKIMSSALLASISALLAKIVSSVPAVLNLTLENTDFFKQVHAILIY